MEKIISGKKYKLIKCVSRKGEAQKYAKELRATGVNVRVIDISKQYPHITEEIVYGVFKHGKTKTIPYKIYRKTR